MVRLGKLGVACALCLTMSLALFSSGVFAQSANQSIARGSAQIVAVQMVQGAKSVLQNNQRMHANGSGHGWDDGCGAGCDGGNGCFNGCGGGHGFGCFDGCGHGFGHERFIRATRITKIVRIVRITKFVRYERFHRRGYGWVGGGGNW